LKEELVAPIEEVLESVFNRTVVPALEEMTSTVTSLSDFSTNSSTAALEGIVDSFLDKLTASSNMQLDSLSEQLKTTSESMATVKESMELITEKQLGASILNNESSRIVENMVINIDDVTEKLQQLKKVAEAVNELTSLLTSSTSEHNRVISAFSDRGEKIAEQLENVYSQTSRLWTDHNTSFEKLSDAVEVGVPRFAEEVNKSLGGVLSKFDAELTRAVRSLEGLLDDMQNSFDELSDRLEENKVEPAMAKSVDKFTDEIANLSSDLKKYRVDLERLNG
jgi:ABC-type transporter Mla subunit MlaD